MEGDRAGTRKRRCLIRIGLYPEEVTVARDRDKDGAVPHGHIVCACIVCVCMCVLITISV